MKKAIFLFAAAVLALSSGAATKKGPYNKYGMTLSIREGEDAKVASVSKIKALYGIDVYTLDDALKPYKRPAISVYDKDTKMVRTEDYVYKKYPDGRELSISVDFAMDQSKPAPVLFTIHGGSWQRGTRSAFQETTKTLAKNNGITCVRVQYTLLSMENDAMFQDMLDDCRDAVRYVIDHAKELNVNPKSLGFTGSSAGGHLAAATALQFPQTKVLVGWVGPYDIPLIFETIYKDAKPNSPVRKALKNCNREYMESVSPQYMAKAPIKFASLLLQGGCDTTVPAASATNFAKKLKECGARTAEAVIYPYGTHALTSGMYAEDACAKAMEFFVKYLK